MYSQQSENLQLHNLSSFNTEDITWPTTADTFTSLCAISSSRMSSPFKCCFSVLRATDLIPCQSYKGGCNQSRHSTGQRQDTLSPFPKQGLHLPPPSSGLEKLPLIEAQCHQLAARQYPASVRGSHWISDPVGRRNHFFGHGSQLLQLILAAAPNFALPWRIASVCNCRRQGRCASNDIQKCKFCSPLPALSAVAICVGALGCMREVSALSFLPCKPDLKLAEVKGSLSLFLVSVDQHHFKS